MFSSLSFQGNICGSTWWERPERFHQRGHQCLVRENSVQERGAGARGVESLRWALGRMSLRTSVIPGTVFRCTDENIPLTPLCYPPPFNHVRSQISSLFFRANVLKMESTLLSLETVHLATVDENSLGLIKFSVFFSFFLF